GTRWWLRRRNRPQPGMARSRENAYHVRDALVRPAMPQNSCPTVAMMIVSLAAHELSAVVMTGIEPPPPVLMSLTCVAAKTSASSTSQPISPEIATDCHTPLAAATEAPRVSSAVWADASYPVMVYIVSRNPIGITRIQNGKPPTAPPSKPVLLILWPKTKLALWCWSGTKISRPMITATPRTCQNTEMLLNSATSGELKMFTSA